MPEVLVVGSIGYDTIKTSKGFAERTLGGSAAYFSVGASLYNPVNLVAVVGDDYKAEDKDMLSQRNINLHGLQEIPGKTFHWKGQYGDDMNEVQTLDTQLNVFKSFDPTLPSAYQDSEFVFLANIDPSLQARVLGQTKKPKFIGMDTMNFWIESKVDELKNVLSQVDCFFVNEGEAKKLSGTSSCVKAAQILSQMGPQLILIKRGEYGLLAFYRTPTAESGHFLALPAFPVKEVVDPTGAGDTFAAGFLGHLSQGDLTYDNFKEACIHGSLLASFTVEDFGLKALQGVTLQELRSRHEIYQRVLGQSPLPPSFQNIVTRPYSNPEPT